MAISISNITTLLSQNPITTVGSPFSRKWTLNSISMPPKRRAVGLGCSISLPHPLHVEEEEARMTVADSWRKIHGIEDWAGMLDPFDRLLRSELIRYGDMAQACYDAFNLDPGSKFCGSSQIKPSMFFQCLGRSDSGYDVTTYLYSTYNVNLPHFFGKSLLPDAWSQSANWIGYVAVSNDEMTARLGRRDITVAWRGTVMKREWLADLRDFLKQVAHQKIPSRDPTIKVEAGFLHVYTDKNDECEFSKYSAREQVLAELNRLTQLYAGEKMSISITGHSLGSALATLSAYDIAETAIDVMDDGEVIPVCVFSFAGPRVGNARFKQRLEGLGVKVLRVVNIHDKVPTVPGYFFNEHSYGLLQKLGEMSPWSYSHVGEELTLDHTTSPFLKEKGDLATFHNLEVLLHLLDGYHGQGRRFWRRGERNIALVNKTSDFLKEYIHVPANWWHNEKNKGFNCNNHEQQHDLKDLLPPEDIHDHLRQLGLAC